MEKTSYVVNVGQEEKALVEACLQNKIDRTGQANIYTAIQDLVEKEGLMSKSKVFAAAKQLVADGKLRPVSVDKQWTFGSLVASESEKARLDALKKKLENYKRG